MSFIAIIAILGIMAGGIVIIVEYINKPAKKTNIPLVISTILIVITIYLLIRFILFNMTTLL